jgi:hypothetical protein
MHIKIEGGTAHEGDPPLCYTCRSATIARGPRLADEVIECHALASRITFPVTFCTRYVNRQHPSIHEMEEIAWVLRTDASRQRIGFVQPKRTPWKDRVIFGDD